MFPLFLLILVHAEEQMQALPALLGFQKINAKCLSPVTPALKATINLNGDSCTNHGL